MKDVSVKLTARKVALSFKWTEERDARLRELWLDGTVKSKDIAKELGTSVWILRARAAKLGIKKSQTLYLDKKAYLIKYRTLNREKLACQRKASGSGTISSRNRRARKKNAQGRHSKTDIDKLFSLQKGRCANPWCKVNIKDKFHVDHIKPLFLGGRNDRKNLQLLCASCNLSKGHKHPVDFAIQNGMLI